MISLPENKMIIFYDTECVLCDNSIQKIIHFDKNNTFVFASLNTPIGISLLNQLNIKYHGIDSIILSNGDKFYFKSSAVLKIVAQFGFLGRLAQVFWLIPKFIRDYAYDLIARNRYKWFGKKEQCLLITDDNRKRFLL